MSLSHRPMQPGDRAFVVKSWRDSFFAEHSSGPILDSCYDRAYQTTIDAILDARGTMVLMAAFEFEQPPNDLVGYLVVEERAHAHDNGKVQCGRPIVHYCYVKGPLPGGGVGFRRKGVARSLMQAARIDLRGAASFCATFKTRTGFAIVRDTWTGGRFDPLVVRFMPIQHTTERTHP